MRRFRRLGNSRLTRSRAAEIEVGADHGFEELAAVHRRGEDLGQAHLELPDAQAVTISSGTIGRRQGPGQLLEPVGEERLHIVWAEGVGQLLQTLWVGAPQEAVVQTIERDRLFA